MFEKKDNLCNICRNDNFETLYFKRITKYTSPVFSVERTITKDYPLLFCNVCGNIQKQIDIHEAH